MQRRLLFIPLGAALLLAATCVAADPPIAAQPKWEYRVVDLGDPFRALGKEADHRRIIETLDKLGLEGWEPIAVVAQPETLLGTGGGAIASYSRWFYYKRPLAASERKNWEFKLVDLPLHFPHHSKADGTTERRVTNALATFAGEGWEVATVFSGWCESEWWKPGAEGPRFYVLKRVRIDNPNRKEQENLQGAWDIVSIESEGEKIGPVRPMKWIIKDNRITQSIVNIAGAEREWSFKLDPSTNPKVIDITMEDPPPLKGQTVEGIYELKGDELKVCINWARDAPKQRPTSFETKSTLNFGMYLLRREKP